MCNIWWRLLIFTSYGVDAGDEAANTGSPYLINN